MIENTIKQFRAQRLSASKRVNTGGDTKQRLGLAQRDIARSEDETSRALDRASEAREAQYSPADSINSWSDSIQSLRAERASREQSTTGALSMVPAGDGSNGGGDSTGTTRPQSRSGVGDSTYAEEIRQGLVERGMPDHIARGFVMNFRDESGLNPDINEANPLVEGSRGGFGLYQLTGPRRTDYEAKADADGMAYGSTEAQLDWLMYEYNGSESSAAEKINATETPGEAAAAIVRYFLRPSPEHVATRSARYLGTI
jgi:hypothetical protein